jgi:glycine/D-amino acid oxidase-like deaminating enzyme
MKRRELHVVIGAGIAGCLSAIVRSRAGYDVVLLEKETARSPGTYPVCTQTSNIVSENHSGAEYPFDPQSARDCLDGRIANERFFPEFIFGGKTYSRIIASQSMMDAGHDIAGQCRSNMEVIRSQYARRCEDDPANAVFGEPSTICHEIPTVSGVNDVATAFITPQRGINPVLTAAVLDWELRLCGVDLRQGSTVATVTRRDNGRYFVEYVTNDGTKESLVADQVSLCTATAAFGLAKELNPAIRFPQLFAALRAILYVDLPDGTENNFTCLKLEDSYGGMFSVMNEDCAMIYYPPAAHIMNVMIDPAGCRPPPEYARYLATGHPELEERAEQTIGTLRKFYPELRRSKILGSYLKVAINTVSDSRVRRNIGVFALHSGSTVTVLPKWTMCVVNAKKELALALDHSIARGNASSAEGEQLLELATKRCWETYPEWARDPEALVAETTKHAMNMHVPEELAHPFGLHEDRSPRGERDVALVR